MFYIYIRYINLFIVIVVTLKLMMMTNMKIMKTNDTGVLIGVVVIVLITIKNDDNDIKGDNDHYINNGNKNDNINSKRIISNHVIMLIIIKMMIS